MGVSFYVFGNSFIGGKTEQFLCFIYIDEIFMMLFVSINVFLTRLGLML